MIKCRVRFPLSLCMASCDLKYWGYLPFLQGTLSNKRAKFKQQYLIKKIDFHHISALRAIYNHYVTDRKPLSEREREKREMMSDDYSAIRLAQLSNDK